MYLHKRTNLITTIALFGLVLTACAGSNPTPTANCAPGANSIAFLSNRPEDNVGDDLYLINGDGSCRTRLTQNPGGVSSPAWFADGKRLLVNYPNDGLYIVHTDGSPRTPFPSLGMVRVYDYAFSSDGKHLAFSAADSSSEQHHNTDIFVINADGTGSATDLTMSNSDLKQDYTPSWSPDGKQIAFLRGVVNSDHQIYLMNADGSNLQLLKINFGDKPSTVTTRNVPNFTPLSWSADGKQLAFTSARDATSQIYSINVADALKDAGSEPTNLSHNAFNDGGPSWSPDGKNIAFLSDRDSQQRLQFHLYIMNSDGSNAVQLSHSHDDFGEPIWVP